MRERDDSWTQVFQDKPVAAARLDDLHERIMAGVLSDPADFAARSELARRRRWGLAFAGSCLGLGLTFLLLFSFLPRTWLVEFSGKLQFVVGLKVAAESLWQEYSWHLSGLIITAGCLIVGFKGSSPLSRREDTGISW